MKGLSGKVAIVTGAGSGIGQGIAKRLGQEGAKVIVDYIGDPAGARDTLEAIEQAGGEGEIVRADVTSTGDDRCLVDEAWKRFGAADFLVNNAGMEHKSDFLGHHGSRLRQSHGGESARAVFPDASNSSKGSAAPKTPGPH